MTILVKSERLNGEYRPRAIPSASMQACNSIWLLVAAFHPCGDSSWTTGSPCPSMVTNRYPRPPTLGDG